VSVSRIKTITIAALALINIFFGAYIVRDTAADARSERQAVENACAVLRAGGIAVEPGDVTSGDAIIAMRTARGIETEELIARTFLGSADMTDQGVIYLYENSARGSAVFYSGGDFVINLNEGVITNSGGAQKTAQRLLRDMKTETTALIVATNAESETVTAVCSYKGASIFNCQIEFAFSSGSLRTVKGRYVAGIEPVEDGAVIAHAGTALLGFLASVRRGDVECTQIISAEAGYQHSVVGSFGEGVIAPVWQITTDTGIYIAES